MRRAAALAVALAAALLLAAITTSEGAGDVPLLRPETSPRMLAEGGDCLGDEVLGWRRLRAERRAIVDNDDSAPVACVDPAGRVYVATGSGKLLTSDNGGESFASAAPISVDGKPVGDVQAMAVLASSAPRRPWLGKPRGPLVIAFGENGRLRVARSEDDGKSWQSSAGIVDEGLGRIEAGGVRILQLSDGSLLLPVSAWKSDGRGVPEGLVYSSRDQGKTWSRLGTLGPRCHAANLLQLKTGALLAAVTYRGPRMDGDPASEARRDDLFNNTVVARSSDGGKTWHDYRCVTRYKESPADLTELSDGTVVLTYGEQNFPYGGRAVVSRDGGRSWDSRVYILGFSTVQLTWSSSPKPTEPGWRVSSVLTRGDVILSLYTRGSFDVSEQYIRSIGYDSGQIRKLAEDGVLGEKGRAVVAVRWTLAGMNKPPMSYPGLLAAPDSEGYLDNGRVQINPEHLNWGGDYFSDDEILCYERMGAERHVVAAGAGATAALDPAGNPLLCMGDGKIYRSTDNGRHWEHVASAPVPGWVSSFGVLKDGALLLAIGIDIYRSDDGGKTWGPPSRMPIPASNNVMGPDECQRINQLPDGTVLMNVCAANDKVPSSPGDAFTFRSRDGGRTWGDWSRGGGHNILRLKSGRILAAFRHEREWAPDDLIERKDIPQNKHRAMLYRVVSTSVSEDNGRHWTTPRTVTRYNETPGDLAELSDGTVVLTYHNKNNLTGPRAMVSRDQGNTWEKTLYMLGWYTASGGFTSSIVLRDGRILTADNGFSPAENRPVTEVTIWKPLASR